MPPDLLIFDLDGVIIDTSESVETAVRRTVQTYFARFLGISGSGGLVSPAAVRAFRAAGFEEPAHLSAALIRYLLSLLPGEIRPREHAPHNVPEAIAFLQGGSRPYHHLTMEALREQAEFQGMAEQIRAAGGGQAGAAQAIPGGWAHPLLLDEGSLEEGNLIHRLVEELYLGSKHFGHIHRTPPRIHRGAGLIEAEPLWSEVGALERLRGHYRGRMAVITRRTEPGARLVMSLLTIDRLFDAVVTREDVQRELARLARRGEATEIWPPHPFMLLEAATHLDYQGSRPALFIGNSPLDMRAVQAAEAASPRSFTGWGVVPPGVEREAARQALTEAGAARLFDRPTEAIAALLAPP